MREILFRGKAIESGIWVTGSLVVTHIEKVRKQQDTYRIEDITHGIDEDGFACFQSGIYEEIDPATVGQYTGLTDKNGNRIFEGDIITHEKAKGVVRLGQYESKAGGNEIGFYIEWHDRVYSGWYRNDIGYWICDVENKAVVSGNIHDNPELLEGMK